MVKILDNGVPVEGSPFTCNAYDTGRITVASLPEVCAVGQPVTFTVDASKAGEGEKRKSRNLGHFSVSCLL